MHRLPSVVSLACVLAFGLLVGPAAFGVTDEKGFVRIGPEEVQWKEPPFGLGVQIAIIEGDPSKPGIYVQRVKFPPGLFSRPHFHPEDRHVVVLKGTWYTGTGDTFDPSKAIPLKAGSYMKHPAGAVHWDGAKDEEVILQIVGYGPSGTTPIRPEAGLFSKQ